MTTKNSPVAKLRFQADIIAKALKLAEAGDTSIGGHAGQLAAARGKDAVTFGVIMDDKALKITMPWTQIRETTEAGIAEFIMRQMREDGSGAMQ
jgi:predicted hotdog family 3-hydroxylacyl-ACP dehydratase